MKIILLLNRLKPSSENLLTGKQGCLMLFGTITCQDGKIPCGKQRTTPSKPFRPQKGSTVSLIRGSARDMRSRLCTDQKVALFSGEQRTTSQACEFLNSSQHKN